MLQCSEMCSPDSQPLSFNFSLAPCEGKQHDLADINGLLNTVIPSNNY